MAEPVDKSFMPPFQGTRCALDPSAISYWPDHLTSLIDKPILPTDLHIVSQSNEHDVFTPTFSLNRDEPFEKALSDSLRDFIPTTWMKDEQKRCSRTVEERKEVFGILYTAFGKLNSGRSVTFQILPRVIKVLCKLERMSVLIRHLEAKRM